jgi:hypothetical protein
LGLILGVIWVSYTNLDLLALNSVATLSIVFNSENHLAVAKFRSNFNSPKLSYAGISVGTTQFQTPALGWESISQ